MNKRRDNNDLPRVLIIGAPFNKKSGGGITMSNLFRGWPRERLALASSANIAAEADFQVCDNYFQLGYNGKLHPFPLNIVLPEVPCGQIKLSQTDQAAPPPVVQRPGRFKKIYDFVIKALDFFGLITPLYRIKITDEFIHWIEDFKPDVIYSQLSTLNSIRLVTELAEKINKPVALHFMDDWIRTTTRKGLLYHYWKKKTETELKELIDRSAILMSIGEEMSEEYRKRYNREFIPFHNPIDLDFWQPCNRKEWTYKRPFTLLYAGRIGLGMKESIIDVARVIDKLSEKNQDLAFEIQSPDIEDIRWLVGHYDSVKLIRPVAYSELPQKFASADLLVLPIDFDDKSIKFLQFSFQTKISEYMISGTPVLVYAPEETATAKYALKNKWACTITSRDDRLLENAIMELYSSQEMRKNLGERAKKLAAEKEDADTVIRDFRACLAQVLQ